MTKQLIYKDMTKVLYMIKNHGVRFTVRHILTGAINEAIAFKFNTNDVSYEDKKAIIGEKNNGFTFFWKNDEYIIESFCYFDSVDIIVHPDDVAKFEPANRDMVLTDIGFIGSNLQNDFVTVCVGKNSLSSYSLDEMRIIKILERDGKPWLPPCEVRDER